MPDPGTSRDVTGPLTPDLLLLVLSGSFEEPGEDFVEQSWHLATVQACP